MVRQPRLLRVLLRTAWQTVPTVAGVIVFIFVLIQLMPGDAADALAGESGSATAESVAILRTHFGLDRPVFAQFIGYLDQLAHFSLGFSPRYNAPVAELIGERLPSTILLMVVALGFALLIGIAMGVAMAANFQGPADRGLSIVALIVYSTPGFWIGLMAIIVFSVWYEWLPAGGAETIGASLSGWDLILDRVRHLVLPALSLSTFYIAIFARLVRTAMLEIQDREFIRTAHANGLPGWRVTWFHSLRNALLPVTTVAGMYFGALLGGAVVTETVFAWPGLGRLAFDALSARDYTVLMGILLVSSLIVIVVNVIVDLLQAWLDPRINVH